MKYRGVQLEQGPCCGWVVFRVERVLWVNRVRLTQFPNLLIATTVWLSLGWPLVTWATKVLDDHED